MIRARDSRPAARAGFTLIEMMIALVMFLAVTSILYASIQLTQRTSRAQSERSALQANLRAAVQVLSTELSEVAVQSAAGATDIVAMSATGISYRSMRASGVTCEVTASQVIIRDAAGLISTGRSIVPGRDSLLLFADRDTLLPGDDQWLALPIISTPSASNCPDGRPGIRLQTAVAALLDVHVPGPVRTFEVMEFAATSSNGQTWLGARSASAGQALTPFLGPIDSTAGVRFTYYDAAGATTTSRTAVRSVDVFVRAATRTPINEGLRPGPGLIRSDTLRVRVSVRNSS